MTIDRISIDKKVAFLKQPGNYPYSAREVKAIETHMSWVFLAGDFVYKLKKPVSYRLFDHRTLQSRLSNSLEEIHINKRLAEDIYLGVVPLVINEKGALQLEGKGKVADWLVKMKRIPDKDMLGYALRHHCIDEARLNQAAIMLAEFYKTAQPVDVAPMQFIRKLEAELFFNHNQLMVPLFNLPRTLIEELTAGQRAFIEARPEIFNKRIIDKKIIDAHGDLRPEHICLSPKIAFIDRLEFCRELRIMDPVQELSLLSVECEVMGNYHVGSLFIDVYRQITSNNIPPPLILFYKIKVACLRAYLVARHIEEPRYKDDPKWISKANAYLQLAEGYHQKLAT